VVKVLGDSRHRLRTAVAHLRAAEGHLAGIDRRTLDARSLTLNDALRRRLPRAIAGTTLLAEVPEIFGYDGPRTYLVLGQNTDELRPTGGFVGTAGVLGFDGGALVRQQYGTSFAYDLPPDLQVPLPVPLQRFMDGRFAGGSYWQLREANWWPDYPSSAWQARYFFGQREDPTVAGVLAVNQDLIPSLLEVTGPISVPEFGEIVGADNVRERMDYYTHEVGAPDEASRKGFVSALFSLLVDRLMSMPRERQLDLARVVEQAFNDQRLLFWSEDGSVQDAVAALGWDGGVINTSGDYLYPVSANLSANKINRDVEQDLRYEVRPGDDGRLIGTAGLRLRNLRPSTDPGPYRTADYRDYVRLYVPTGSELVAATGFASDVEATSECGRTVFAGLVVVSPGAQVQIELVYRLPASLTASGYSLVIQKQPGVPTFPVSVAIDAAGGRLTTDLRRHRVFQQADGRLASWYRPPATRTSASLTCEAHTAPPRTLRPPVRLEIPSLALDAEVVDVGVDARGRMESPTAGDVVGWYRQAARPGQPGNMIVSGHLDWDKQPAVFWRLHDLAPGAPIRVVDDSGTSHVYRVDWSRSINAKSTNLNEIIGPTTRRWLTLITCAGRFDPVTRDYAERLIVRASLGSEE
jgi:hypothetical protein